MKQRPAAVGRLNAPEIARDLRFELGVDRLAAIVAHQDIFGRDRRVGLELEDEMAVVALQRAERARRRGDRDVELVARCAERGCFRLVLDQIHSDRPFSPLPFRPRRASVKFAAVLPERMAPSIVAGSPVAVQSPARKRLREPRLGLRPLGILLGQRGEGGAALFDDVPRRHVASHAGHLGDILPDRLRKLLARGLDEAVGGADGRGDPVGIGEQPFGSAVDDAEQARKVFGRRDLEMRIDDRAERFRSVEIGKHQPRDRGGHGENDGIAGGELDRVLAEIEQLDLAVGNLHAAKLVHEAELGPVAFEISERRVDKGRPETLRGDQRVAGAAATRQRLAQNRARQESRGLARLGVERGKKERARQPLVQNAAAIDDLVDALVAARRRGGASSPDSRAVRCQARGGPWQRSTTGSDLHWDAEPSARRTPSRQRRIWPHSVRQASLRCRSSRRKASAASLADSRR